jgi:hypothetical protein
MRLAGVLIGPAILAFLIVTGLSYVVPEPRSESQTQAAGLAWSGRIFTSRAEFARWLDQRGGSYEEWSRLHPGSPWATPRPTTEATEPAPEASGSRTLAANAETSSDSMLVAVLGAALVLVIGLLAIGVALLVRMKMTVDRLMEPSVFAPRTLPMPSGNGAKSVIEARPRLGGAGQAARRGVEAALPRIESAGSAARRGVEAAGPRLESASLVARRGVEAALPRIESAGSAAIRGVEAAAAETLAVGGFVRYAIATGRMRGALLYAFAAVFSAAIGLATAILI